MADTTPPPLSGSLPSEVSEKGGGRSSGGAAFAPARRREPPSPPSFLPSVVRGPASCAGVEESGSDLLKSDAAESIEAGMIVWSSSSIQIEKSEV